MNFYRVFRFVRKVTDTIALSAAAGGNMSVAPLFDAVNLNVELRRSVVAFILSPSVPLVRFRLHRNEL